MLQLFSYIRNLKKKDAIGFEINFIRNISVIVNEMVNYFLK